MKVLLNPMAWFMTLMIVSCIPQAASDQSKPFQEGELSSTQTSASSNSPESIISGQTETPASEQNSNAEEPTPTPEVESPILSNRNQPKSENQEDDDESSESTDLDGSLDEEELDSVDSPDETAEDDNDKNEKEDDDPSSCEKFEATFSGDPVTVEGQDFQPEAIICDTKTNHLGSAIRNRFGDRFILSAYTEGKSCDPAEFMDKVETKYLRMDITRDTDGANVAQAMQENLERNTPEDITPELEAQIEKAVDAFSEDVQVGDKVEIFFVPKKGTMIKSKSQELEFPDQEINKLLWKVFFGPETCCEQTRDAILEMCAASFSPQD